MRPSDFDALLNEVLKEKIQAAPRPGMEQRILIRALEEKRKDPVGVPKWWLATATSLAACFVVAVAMHHRFAAADHTSIHMAPTTTTRVSSAENRLQNAVIPQEQKAVPLHPEPVKGRLHAHSISRDAKSHGKEELPKMETFPTRAPKDPGDLLAKSPQAIKALQDLKNKQERPLQISAIEIQPL